MQLVSGSQKLSQKLSLASLKLSPTHLKPLPLPLSDLFIPADVIKFLDDLDTQGGQQADPSRQPGNMSGELVKLIDHVAHFKADQAQPTDEPSFKLVDIYRIILVLRHGVVM